MTGRIFISYRRADSQYATDRIYERLEAQFGSENVFMDIDDIPLGVNFRVYIDQQVSTSDIVLAVIGDHWLDSTDPEGNLRLHNPSDFVRLELEAALKQGIKLIPVFIGGVQAIPASKLPESLQELPMLNATRIRRGKDFLPDVERLIRGIQRIFTEQTTQREQNKAALAELKDSATEIINRLNTFEALMIQDMRKRTVLEREAQQFKEQLREHLSDPKKQLRVDIGVFSERVEKLQDNLMELALQIEEGKQARALEAAHTAAEKIAEQQAEHDRLAKEIAEKQRKEKEIAEADRIAREKAEAEQIAREKAEADRRAREKAEAELKAKEIAEKDRKAKEIAEVERIAKQKAEAERRTRQKAEVERKARQKADRAAQRREQIAQLKALVGKVPVWAWAAVAVVVLGIIFGPMVWNGITSIVSSSQTPDFVKSLQIYVDENPPDFEDDFSSVKDSSWSHVLLDNHITDENLDNYIQGGYFLVNHSEADNWGEINLGDLEGNTPLIGTDFVLELDVAPTRKDDPNAMFVVYFRSITTRRQNIFGINENEWIVLYEDMDDTGEIVRGQSDLLKIGETNKIQIFAQGDQVAFYINGELLTQVQHNQIMGSYNNFGFAVGEKVFQGGIDNIRFWNLDEEKPILADESEDVTAEAEVLAEFATQVTSNPPGFSDDFEGTERPYWTQNLNEDYEVIDFVSGGKFRIQDSPETRTAYAFRPIDAYLSDFIFQFEFTPQQFDDESLLNIEFRSGTNGAYVFRFAHAGAWDLSVSDGDPRSELTGGSYRQFMTGETYSIRLIALFDEIAVMLNEEILGYVRDASIDQGELQIAVEASSPFQVDLDNIQVWDLSGELGLEEYQSSQSEGERQQYTEDAKAFAESVLAYLGGTAPTFSEDFEAIQPYMYEQPVYQDEQQDAAMAEVVVDGVLHLDSTNIVMSNDRWGFNFVDMRAENYALQFDFAILENQSEEVINISKGPGPDMGVGYNSHIMYSSDGNMFEMREEAPDSSEQILLTDFIQYPDREATYTLLLIFYDSRFAAFLDGTFLGYLEGLQFSIDQEILFNVNAPGTTVVNFDNIQFWNLDGVEIGEQREPTVVEPGFDYERLLAKIERELQPTFEDDFSQADMVWGGTSEGLAIWALVDGGELMITDHAEDVDWTSDHAVRGLTFPTNGLFDAGNFLFEFDYSFRSVYEIGIRFRSSRDLESGYKFYAIQGGGWVLSQEKVIESGSYLENGGSNHIRLLVVDQYLAVILNNELKFVTDDLTSIGTTNRIWVSGEHGSEALFDNVKFWNLDGVDFE